MDSSHWPVSLHSRFEGAFVGLVAAFHGLSGLNRPPDRDRRSLDDAIQTALKLATLLGTVGTEGLERHEGLGLEADGEDDRGELGATLTALGHEATGHGDRLALALLPLMLRWFDRPDTLATLWERASHQPVPEAVAFGAIILGRSMTHDAHSIHQCLAVPSPDRLWEQAASPLADWQSSDRRHLDWPQRLRSPHSDAVPLLVALHSTLSSGGRWPTALARSQQHSASAALWTGALVGALGGVAAIPAFYGAMIPDSTLGTITHTTQQLIDQWSGRIPSRPADRQTASSIPSRRASGPPFSLRPVVMS